MEKLNFFTKIAFKYFSKSTKKEDKWLKELSISIFVLLFLFGFVGTILGLPKLLIGIVTITDFILIFILVSIIFIGVFTNNIRLKKKKE